MAVCVGIAVSVVAGLVTTAGWVPWSHPQEADYLRQLLNITGGALFFGGGVIQLSTPRIHDGASRVHAGIAMVVFGLSVCFLSGLGHLFTTANRIHGLNPYATALIAVITLMISLVAPANLGAKRSLAFGIALFGLCAVPLFVALLVRPHALAWVPAQPSPVGQVTLELSIAALWLGVAFVAHRSRSTLTRGRQFRTPVLVALGLVWVMRAAAVDDAIAWGFASAVLLALTAVVLVAVVTSELGTAADEEHLRLSAAEAALHSTTKALAARDRHDRDLRHDARNVVCALRIANQTLIKHGEVLDPESRQRLREAIAAEVSRLSEIVETPEPAASSGYAGRSIRTGFLGLQTVAD